MQLQTLGGLALYGASFSRPKPLLLLVYLALEGSKDRHHLVELFWPEASEPMNSLRVALSQLRAVAPNILEDSGAGLTAKVDSDAVRLLAALDADDPVATVNLYRGGFLAGFYLAGLGSELEEWIYATREVLADRVQEVLLRSAEREAAEGGFEAAARRAETALGFTPVPEPERLERFYRILMAGRRPSASFLQHTASEYGIALGLTSREAQEQLFSGGAPTVPHNLLARPSSFVGRDPELIELARLLSEPDTRLIALTGAGGVGKSRLALEAAHLARREAHFQDGVYFVPLEALTEPDLVPPAIAHALGINFEGTESLKQALAAKRLLLVLDNFEQLMTEASFISGMIRECPHLKLLVTSRERLNLEGEQVFMLEGLGVPPPGLEPSEAAREDAVQLFLQRAKRTRLDFELSQETLPHILKICRLTQSIPLGIELAAAWVRLLPVADIASEIESSLDFLTASQIDVADRHRSLRATFEHSWQLLTHKEHQALRQLSVFVGGFTREAASWVAGATIPTLASLADKSLLRVLENGRFDRHPLLYQYTQEKLTDHPQELVHTQERHSEYFSVFIAQAEEGFKGADQALWLERLEAEHDNVRAVLSRAILGVEEQVGRGLQISGALWQFWHIRGHLREGRAWYDRLLEAHAPSAWAERAKALSGAGVLAFAQGDYTASNTYHAEALNIRRQLGLDLAAARSLYNLGSVAGAQGDLEAAKEFFEQSLEVFRKQGDPWTIATSLTNVATLASRLGKVSEARKLHEESLHLRRTLGDQHGVARALQNVASIAHQEGEHTFARSLFVEALAISDKLGDQLGIINSLEAVATLDTEEGLAEQAVRLWAAAEILRETVGAPTPIGKRESYEQKIGEAQACLEEAAFLAAWREGQTASLKEIISSLTGVLEDNTQVNGSKQ